MPEFLIKDYSECEGRDLSDVKLRIVGLKELLDEIDDAREDKSRKIVVYAIEDCLLDWS